MLKNLTRWLDPIVLIGTLISIGIGFAMVLFGNDTATGLTIGLLSTITTLLIDIIARIQKAEHAASAGNQEILATLERDVQRLVADLQGVDIRVMEKWDDFTTYFERRIKTIKHSLDVTHFALSSPNDEPLAGKRYYEESFTNAVKNGKFKVRRILVVRTQNHLEWAHQMLNEYKGSPFYLGCYPRPSQYVHMLNLMIIDSEEVLISGGERSPSYDYKVIAIKHPMFARTIQEHFDKVWRESWILNETSTRRDFLSQLENSLK